MEKLHSAFTNGRLFITHPSQNQHRSSYREEDESYEYIASVLPSYVGASADGRVVIAHLGGGASMCALRDRSSVATSMGFTALDGLPMDTRCGALDPGVVLYLMSDQRMDL